MVKRRHRYKHTTTLAQRLTQEAGRLRERARQLPPGTEQTTLLRKVGQAETALRIDAWLSSAEQAAPADVMTLVGKSGRKQSTGKAAHRSA